MRRKLTPWFQNPETGYQQRRLFHSDPNKRQPICTIAWSTHSVTKIKSYLIYYNSPLFKKLTGRIKNIPLISTLSFEEAQSTADKFMSKYFDLINLDFML